MPAVFSSYMDMVYQPEKAIAAAKDILKDVQYDTMVGTGLSGALMIPTLARGLNVDFLLIRKPNDGSHASSMCEGRLGDKWLFVDDLIETGRTLQRVYQEVGKAAKQRRHSTRFAGAYLYESTRYQDFDTCHSRWLFPFEPDSSESREPKCQCPLCAPLGAYEQPSYTPASMR